MSGPLRLTGRQLRVLRSLKEPAVSARELSPRVVRVGYDRPLAAGTVRRALEDLRDLELVTFKPPPGIGWSRTMRGEGAALGIWVGDGYNRWRRE